MSTIAELAPDRTVEGVYAVARKQRRTTRKGAPYLALELVDPTGRIEGRIWNDVELLDGRFAEGDAVRVLGRVERFDDRLQLEIRSVEAADADPAGLAPRLRRDADELDGFLEFLAGEIAHPGLARSSAGSSPIRRCGRRCASSRPPRRTTRTRAACSSTRSASPRSCARRRSCTRGSARDLVLAAALLHDVGRVRELGRGPAFRPTDEGRLLGHVHLGLRLIEERAGGLDAAVRAELLHAVASHHDRNAARTAEAAVLYHANQLDAVAATKPVE